jgi:hypothetical protein
MHTDISKPTWQQTTDCWRPDMSVSEGAVLFFQKKYNLIDGKI